MIDAEKKTIRPEELLAEVLHMKTEGWRMIQICATRIQYGYELVYSFGKEYRMVNLTVPLAEEAEIASISDIYSPAFLYENEIRDLFGTKIEMISVDYKGNLYRIAEKTPYKTFKN